MRSDKVFNRPQQLLRRRELRGHLTPAEAALWDLLKNSKLQGRKFRRQHGIEHFIVDFCCRSENLVIELDGEVHNDPMQTEYDAIRDARLREMGFKILRFENKEVFQNSEAVLYMIAAMFETGASHPPLL